MLRIENSVFSLYNLDNTNYLNVEDVEFYQFKDPPYFNKRFINQFYIIYMINGSLCLSINKEKLLLQEKDLLFLSPFQSLQFAPNKTNSSTLTSFYIVSFSADRFPFFDLSRYKQIRNAGVVEHLLTDLYYEEKDNEKYTFYHDAILLLIIKTGASSLSSNIALHNDLAEQIRDYILHNIMTPITVTDIGKQFQYNKIYLTRIFKKQYGISIQDYINQEKLSFSKRLLQTTNLPVVSVARMLGYMDTTLFTKFFKYHTNMTPTDYRKHILG